jgi:hypothetical protein
MASPVRSRMDGAPLGLGMVWFSWQNSLPIYLIFFAAIAFTIFLPEVVLWLPRHVCPESVGCFKTPFGPGYICP